VRMFVDGVASPVTDVGALTQGPSLSIGGFGSYPFFDGTIDEVRISNLIRYTSDFEPSDAPFSPDANTVGLWHFDEGQGQVASDVSSSGNDGTLGDTGDVDSALATSRKSLLLRASRKRTRGRNVIDGCSPECNQIESFRDHGIGPF
jgi:hypothetical protein